jgi:hypothetical protein
MQIYFFHFKAMERGIWRIFNLGGLLFIPSLVYTRLVGFFFFFFFQFCEVAGPVILQQEGLAKFG